MIASKLALPAALADASDRQLAACGRGIMTTDTIAKAFSAR
jgi:N-acetylglutamate synthase/N-acetylornithine aminotransferase